MVPKGNQSIRPIIFLGLEDFLPPVGHQEMQTYAHSTQTFAAYSEHLSHFNHSRIWHAKLKVLHHWLNR